MVPVRSASARLRTRREPERPSSPEPRRRSSAPPTMGAALRPETIPPPRETGGRGGAAGAGAPVRSGAAAEEQRAAEDGGGYEAGDHPDAHVDEGEGGQVPLAALAALHDQEDEWVREERLHEHEGEPVGEPDAKQTQKYHGRPRVLCWLL